MTTPIALILLFVFTTAVAILITIWVKRANTRAEQIPKENKAQFWCIVDGKTMPFEEAVVYGHVKVKIRYDTCGDEKSELRGRELDVN
jgi:membrane protein implicated in regulation of membrane protease activity